MQSLFVILAVFSAVVAADHPMVINQDVTTNTFAYTSSEFLKFVLAGNSGNNVVTDDVVSLLSTLGLTEAANIATQIDLRTVLRNDGYGKLDLHALVKFSYFSSIHSS